MRKNISLFLFISILILECINQFVFSSNKFFDVIKLIYLGTQFIPLITGIFLSIVIHKNIELNKLKKVGIALFIYQLLNILSGILLVIHFPIFLLVLFFSKGWLIILLNINNLAMSSIISFIEMILFIVSCLILNLEIVYRLKRICK